ncbi:MAG: IS4 family transposase [Actinomycetota bacterium]|nr:IS4 family transposase [Actinomycetota bacterium]
MLMVLPALPVPVPLPVPVSPVLDPTGWAEQTYGAAQLGDARRTRRLVRTMAAIAAQPAASLPQQLRAWSALKAAYRLLHAPAVTGEAILAPHLAATRAAAATPAVVLLIQDLTELDFTAHRATVGLGPLGNGYKHGLLLQSALAVLPADGTVLGLAALDVFPRIPAPRTGERSIDRQARPRESDAWGRLVDAIGPPPAAACWVHVGDRGSDVFTFLSAARRQGTQVLLRVVADRRLTTEEGEIRHLREYGCSLRPRAERELAVPGRAKTSRHPPRAPRTARMAVSWAAVTVAAPFHSRQQAPLPVWLVRTWELDPPPDEPEPLDWLLLTTVPTTTAEAAWERVDWYCRRWLIEDYHQCLKTGCRLEQSQLRDGAAVQRLVGMLAPVAVRLLQLRAAARVTPARPAAPVVGERVVQVLAALTRQPPDLSCAQFWQLVAQLGGHLGRTRDGPPGWRTIWRGWQHLHTVLAGVELTAHLAPP